MSDHTAFEMLDTRLQRQLYAMKWPSLRAIQVDTIRAYLGGTKHLMLMAETAAGKTEAAFLPVLSSIVDEPFGSVRVMYVGPLKALINDQFSRLEILCTHLEMPVYRWHGDVGAAKKRDLVSRPGGVLLITPESIESLLINRTAHLEQLFGGLRAIVVDELHAFLEGERGLHLASLLRRIARYRIPTEPAIRLIGLSATIGDRSIGQRYLCPENPGAVDVITDENGGGEIRIRVHGYDGQTLIAGLAEDPHEEMTTEAAVDAAIAEDLVEHCRGHSNLIFANAKGDIEIMADAANEGCRHAGLPESFLVHHGSLSREVREDTEERMKSDRPHTAICSSTLEMGIDIGSVRMVGQIGPPWSVASIKQRMGRSGRKSDEARRLRCYIDCTITPEAANPISFLPLELLQMVAVCDLMLEGWVEPPASDQVDLSTLTHQIISTISELGAASASNLYEQLCQTGAFHWCGTDLFGRLLRALGRMDILEQGSDKKLILGLLGEKLRSRQDFYAAFASRIEYAVIAGNRLLGTLPLDTLPNPGDHIVFAARRWHIKHVDTDRHAILVVPANRRRRPRFVGSGGMVHHRIVERMRFILASNEPVTYLDSTSHTSLSRAREYAIEHRLAERRWFGVGPKATVWLTWAGSAETMTYQALLSSVGVDSRNELVGLVCDCSVQDLAEIIEPWTKHEPDMLTLAEHVQPKRRRKYDDYLSDDLLDVSLASLLSWRLPDES